MSLFEHKPTDSILSSLFENIVPILIGAAIGLIVAPAIPIALDYLKQFYDDKISHWLSYGANTLPPTECNNIVQRIKISVDNNDVEYVHIGIDKGLRDNHSLIVTPNQGLLYLTEFDNNANFIKGTHIFDQNIYNKLDDKILIIKSK
jgi:hypothetical protein